MKLSVIAVFLVRHCCTGSGMALTTLGLALEAQALNLAREISKLLWLALSSGWLQNKLAFLNLHGSWHGSAGSWFCS
jgi:hypothetical protein